MANGTMVRTEGVVQFAFKYGGYRGEISIRVFPNMSKQMILGILWLSKENHHIDWTQVVVVMKKGQNWISLPLAKSQRQNLVHPATKISATQLDRLLKEEEVERAFLGIIQLIKEE